MEFLSIYVTCISSMIFPSALPYLVMNASIQTFMIRLVYLQVYHKLTWHYLIKLRYAYFFVRLVKPAFQVHWLKTLWLMFIFFYSRGKNVLNQKSELEKALSKHKEKQIMNQVKEHKETPGKWFTDVQLFLSSHKHIPFLKKRMRIMERPCHKSVPNLWHNQLRLWYKIMLLIYRCT